MKANELYHHGVKGQKWGVRRYQNKDGSLTSAGKARLEAAGHLNKEYMVTKKLDDETFSNRKKRIEDAGIHKKSDDDDIIKKGSKLYRITGSDEDVGEKRKYASLTDNDYQTYQEVFDALEFDPNSQDMHLDRYEAKRDLKLANNENVAKYIVDKYGDMPVKDLIEKSEFGPRKQEMTEFINKKWDVKVRDIYTSERNVETLLKDNATKEDALKFEIAKKSSSYFRRNVLTNESTNSKVFEHYRKLGYDAIADIEDGEFADYPVVLLNPKESVNRTLHYRWGG